MFTSIPIYDVRKFEFHDNIIIYNHVYTVILIHIHSVLYMHFHFTIQIDTVSNLNNKILVHVFTIILISTSDRKMYVPTGRIIYSCGQYAARGP